MFGALIVALAQAAAGEPQLAAPEAVPTPPVAQPAAQVAPAPEAQPVRARDRLHCSYEAVTGSRLGRKVCRTQAEMDRQADTSRKMLESLQGARTAPTN